MRQQPDRLGEFFLPGSPVGGEAGEQDADQRVGQALGLGPQAAAVCGLTVLGLVKRTGGVLYQK